MQLDKTRIVIRPRSTSELLDLSLKIFAIYFRPLLILTSLFAIPLMIVNELMLGKMVADELSSYTIPPYLSLMGLLVFMEGPVATIATTLFLGRMMFLQETEIPFVLKQIRQYLHRIFWTQVILRGVLIGMYCAACAAVDESYHVLMWMIAIVVILVRMARPYINEIILLEQNPLRAKRKEVITVRRRSHSLHGQSSGDLVARWLLTAPAVVFMTISLVLSFWFLQGVLTNHWNWNWIVVRVFVPVAMWLAVIYTTVLRFMCYLDLRIRREGWEVELKVQAAAEELKQRFA